MWDQSYIVCISAKMIHSNSTLCACRYINLYRWCPLFSWSGVKWKPKRVFKTVVVSNLTDACSLSSLKSHILLWPVRHCDNFYVSTTHNNRLTLSPSYHVNRTTQHKQISRLAHILPEKKKAEQSTKRNERPSALRCGRSYRRCSYLIV